MSMKPLCVIYLMALIHRYRGTSYPFPTKNIYWCWTAVFVMLVGLGIPWQLSVTFALGYFVWAWPGYMTWARLGHEVPGNQVVSNAWDIKMINAIGGNIRPETGLYLRGFIWALPLAGALLFLGAPHIAALGLIPVGFVSAYELAWKINPKDGDISKIAEPVVGMFWGIAMAIILF